MLVPDASQWNPDSLDIVEAVMALEEAVDRTAGDSTLSAIKRDKILCAIEEVVGASSLSASDRDCLIRAIEARLRGEDFGDDLDDDILGILVRKLGPRGPFSGSAAAKIETEPPSTPD